MMKKGQSAVEFVVLVSFMLIVFFIFFIVIQNRITQVTEQQDYQILQEANNIVVQEVALAQAAAPDFEHTFVISDRGTNGFEINITDAREVVATFEDKSYVNFFPFDVLGHLNALNENNTIYRTDGVVVFPDGTIQEGTGYDGIFMNFNPELCYIADTLGRCGDITLISAEMVTFCSYVSLC
jgi:hypothetical protein